MKIINFAIITIVTFISVIISFAVIIYDAIKNECFEVVNLACSEYIDLLKICKYKDKFDALPITYEELLKKNEDDKEFCEILKNVDLALLNSLIHHFVKNNILIPYFLRKTKIPNYVSHRFHE